MATTVALTTLGFFSVQCVASFLAGFENRIPNKLLQQEARSQGKRY